MKIALTKTEQARLNHLISISKGSINVGDMLHFLITNPPKIDSFEKYEDIIQDYFDLNLNDLETKFYFDNSICQGIKKIDESLLLNNAYYKKIKLNNTKGKYSYKEEKIHIYQPFSYDDISIGKDYLEISKIGYFDCDVKFPSLVYKNNIWMSLHPNEIITMESAIKEAHGNVLVLGLGLGYFPYMISQKSSITSITIVEREKDIIELFSQQILPQFKNKTKITIIEDDAINYMKKNETFDYTFVDLWHDPNDGLSLYMKLLPLENKGKYFYWLETSLVAYLRRIVLTIIEEYYVGYNENYYSSLETPEDRLFNRTYKLMKKITFNSYKEIYEFLSDSSLKKLIKGLY